MKPTKKYPALDMLFAVLYDATITSYSITGRRSSVGTYPRSGVGSYISC